MGVIVKDGEEADAFKPKPAVLHYDEVLIKRYRINYSVPQQVRFGMLPYSALEEYRRQKEEEKEANRLNEESSNQESTQKTTLIKEGYDNYSINENGEKVHNHAFWEDGERERMSNDDYEKFLAEHGLDVGPSAF